MTRHVATMPAMGKDLLTVLITHGTTRADYPEITFLIFAPQEDRNHSLSPLPTVRVLQAPSSLVP